MALPEHTGRSRLLHIHHNVPGVLAHVNERLSAAGINIARNTWARAKPGLRGDRRRQRRQPVGTGRTAPCARHHPLPHPVLMAGPERCFMTHVVTEACIRCKYTDCVDVCPVDAFRAGKNMLVIDPDRMHRLCRVHPGMPGQCHLRRR